MRTRYIHAAVTNKRGSETRYYKINPDHALGVVDKRWATGVELVEVYYLPRLKKLIAEFYSIWDNGSGGAAGTYFDDKSGDLNFCKKAGIAFELSGLTPIED